MLSEVRNYDRDTFCKDIKILSIAERNLQVCIEFLIDISTYIVSKLDVEIPETYREVVDKLHDGGMIDENLKEKLTENRWIKKYYSPHVC
ncbi:MAG: HepT-like ribonuclease domain-containing protein [Nitrososphaeria archaeon]